MRFLPLLLLLAAFAASSDDVQEPEAFWSGPINSAVPATIYGGKVLHVQELTRLLQQTNPVVIDVSNEPKRPPGMASDAPWLPLPQQVIPGSVWLPGVGMADIVVAPPTLKLPCFWFAGLKTSALSASRRGSRAIATGRPLTRSPRAIQST